MQCDHSLEAVEQYLTVVLSGAKGLKAGAFLCDTVPLYMYVGQRFSRLDRCRRRFTIFHRVVTIDKTKHQTRKAYCGFQTSR